MSALAVAGAPGAEEPQLTGDDVIRIFKQQKREAQHMIAKISELEHELGEHELVMTSVAKLAPERKAFRLVGGVLVEQTVGEVIPKITENQTNIQKTLEQLKTMLQNKQDQAAAWKDKYGIRTQQEHDVESKTREAAGQPNKGPAGGATGLLA
ncbi:Prefoldin [Pelagophyceae sp. CCMP2097]|nr:Prefoldin [Pelagophyceae sp. CCMP2097]|mmetsp:Transcript_2152/g.7862  ORF Transcript_2152/g.7862 Transcript_2152/m.7862 type:complete len:153 (+) Transcript_2152:83-541(+)